MIRADELERKVYARVRSHYPPYLHAVLRDILDDTIQRYPGLEVRESVPYLRHSGKVTHLYFLKLTQAC